MPIRVTPRESTRPSNPLQWLNIALSPFQDLHGYDAPWPAGGGVNKYNADGATWDVGHYITSDGTIGSAASYMYDSSYIQVSPSTQYTLQIKKGANTALLCSASEYDSSKVFIVRNASIVTTATGLLSVTFTTSATTEYIRITVPSNNTTEIQLVIGSTAPAVWTPYSNICPILGTDKLNIFAEESYDPAATPKVVIDMPSTIYGGTYDAVSGAGTIDRASVDLGTLTWVKYNAQNGNAFVATVPGAKLKGNAYVTNIICTNYAEDTSQNNAYYIADDTCKFGGSYFGTSKITIVDSSYPDAVKRWSCLPEECVLEITPTLVKSWIYDNNVPYVETWDFSNNTYRKEKQ